METKQSENNITETAVRKPDADIRCFSPKAAFQEELERERRSKRTRRIILILTVAVILCALGVAGAMHTDTSKNQSIPAEITTPDLFEGTADAGDAGSKESGDQSGTPDGLNSGVLPEAETEEQRNETENIESPASSDEAAPTEANITDPFAGVREQVPEPEDDILNVLLIGVDYSAERENWGGKDGLTAAHADVMLVLAVNFTQNKVDLISLPRDTYTMVPGVSGIYKLNGALNCGGGLLAENGAGFEKCCETASYLLGGLPVKHYYAVTMPAVKSLVDAIGGVDYNLDITFSMQGRHYKKGKRHMNGQAVLDYLRVRKKGSGLQPGQTGDVNRVKRQKKMLVAIFNQLKKTDIIQNIPDILEAFDGQLYTNCTKEQTAVLALYGMNIVSSDIGMYSMKGDMHGMYRWNFNFIDEGYRVDLIKKIYGVTVPELTEISYTYAQKLYQIKYVNQAINTCGPLTDYVEAIMAREGTVDENGNIFKISETQQNVYNKYIATLEKCRSVRNSNSTGAMKSACSTMKTVAQRTANAFGYKGSLTWEIASLEDMNMVYVDFR